MTKLIIKQFKLSQGHIDILNKYGTKWNCANDTEALRFLLNNCKREMQEAEQ
jgi:hypothetical protein